MRFEFSIDLIKLSDLGILFAGGEGGVGLGLFFIVGDKVVGFSCMESK